MIEDVTFEQVILQAIETRMLDVHTSMPCTVKVVNGDGTIDATPAISRVTIKGEELALPIIKGVPVANLGNASIMVAMPIAVGDEGLLVFSERDISGFLSGGLVKRPPMLRKHDLSDAIFIPVGLSKAKRVPAVNVLTLEGGGVKMEFDGTLKITGGVDIDGDRQYNNRS